MRVVGHDDRGDRLTASAEVGKGGKHCLWDSVRAPHGGARWAQRCLWDSVRAPQGGAGWAPRERCL